MNTELETWLQETFASLCQANGQPIPFSRLRISPPLAEWEERYFLLGLEENVFAVNEHGAITSPLLEADEAVAPAGVYPLFSREPPRLLRENVCQLATAARLIVERGWLKKHVILQRRPTGSGPSNDGCDLLVRSRAAEILISVEVKRSRLELEKLIADLRACSRRGPHAHEDCGFPQNHSRQEFYRSLRPAYLWAVAPDGEFCLAVTFKEDSLALEPLGSLPPRSLLELG
ncbi:MAG TPA: hypothetical protein VGH00_09475 [Chthoniobacterales bacterium]